MADKPVPTDREAMAALMKLKEHVAAKTAQMKTAGEATPIDDALNTIETWAKDAADDGKAWGARKQAESNESVREADSWQNKVRQDEKDAAQEADARAQMDVKKVKEDMKKSLDDYFKAMKGEADKGTPWAKAKLPEVMKENAIARKFIDEKFETMLDKAAQVAAAKRRRTKFIADQMAERGKKGKKWQEQFGNDPGKHGAGQRADVVTACEQVQSWAASSTAELEPYGAKAGAHLDGLKRVSAWAKELKAQVEKASQPGGAGAASMKAAKANGAAGVPVAKQVKAAVEGFTAQQEGGASDAIDVYTRWTNYNNQLAKQWLASPDDKQRQWAEAWTKTQS